MRPRLILDSNCDNPVQPGYTLIRDDLSFLRAAREGAYAFVQGPQICRWAAEAAVARGWSVVRLTSPLNELIEVAPGLTLEQARSILTSFAGTGIQMKRPLGAQDVASALWPDVDPTGKTEAEHAFAWLEFRSRATLRREERLLLDVVGQSYPWAEKPPFSIVYAASDTIEYVSLLREWLRVKRSEHEWPPFPSEPPDWLLDEFCREWRQLAITTNCQFLSGLVSLGAPRKVLVAAASVVSEFARSNPNCILSQDLLSELRPYVRAAVWKDLQGRVPAERLASPPVTFPAVATWFKERYLRYRVASATSDAHSAHCREIGRTFGEWYLRFYADALTGGPGSSLLSWNRKTALDSDHRSIKLLVMLDGLGYLDALDLISFLRGECRRLTTEDVTLAAAPLPTVTDFAKRALFSGLNPGLAFDDDPEAVQSRDLDVVDALNASSPGGIVMWSLSEPDATYHKPLPPEVLRLEVEGRLHGIAKRLAHIAHKVVDTHPLRIIVTTDHGRLLSPSRRSLPAPQGMIAHGRAAWGPAKVPFDSDGLYIQDDVAFLHAKRFGLPTEFRGMPVEAAAVMLSDSAFLTADGRASTEASTHGGIFPEEVLIPWVELRRDRGPIELSARISGHGIAGTNGIVQLQVTNRSEVRIRIVELQFPTLRCAIRTDVQIGPFREHRSEHSFPSWPQHNELKELCGTILYAMPAGDLVTCRASTEFAVDEMYHRDSTLEDLL